MKVHYEASRKEKESITVKVEREIILSNLNDRIINSIELSIREFSEFVSHIQDAKEFNFISPRSVEYKGIKIFHNQVL